MTSHSISFRVYYEDTDAGGIVYHARYLAFAERARTEALRALGEPVQNLATTDGLIFVVRRLSADYASPLKLDDLADVRTELLSLSFVSCVMKQNIFCGDRLCATLEVELACIRVKDGKLARIPPRWRDLISGLTA